MPKIHSQLLNSGKKTDRTLIFTLLLTLLWLSIAVGMLLFATRFADTVYKPRKTIYKFPKGL